MSSGVASYGALGHVLPLDFQQFHFSSLWSGPKSDSQLSKYSVVCEISWCRRQQLTALLTSAASSSLLHPALKCAVIAPLPNF